MKKMEKMKKIEKKLFRMKVNVHFDSFLLLVEIDVNNLFLTISIGEFLKEGKQEEILHKLETHEIFGVHIKSALNEWIPEYKEKFQNMKIKPVIASLRNTSKSLLLSYITLNLEAYMQWIKPSVNDFDLEGNNSMNKNYRSYEYVVSSQFHK